MDVCNILNLLDNHSKGGAGVFVVIDINKSN